MEYKFPGICLLEELLLAFVHCSRKVNVCILKNIDYSPADSFDESLFNLISYFFETTVSCLRCVCLTHNLTAKVRFAFEFFDS